MSVPAVSVIVPIFNEEGNVVQLQRELQSALGASSHEIIFVDDGSTDDTVAKIDRKPTVRVLQFEKNTGQSAAIYAGLHAARGEVLVLIDGDLQNDPRDIPGCLDEIEQGADRLARFRAKRQDWEFKRIQSRIVNSVRSRFTKDGVRDTGCTLKARRRECRNALIPFYGMHRFIPALIKGFGYKIAEVSVNHRQRQSGVS